MRTEPVKLHFKICVIKFKCTMFESCGFNAQNVKSSEIKLQEIAAITRVMWNDDKKHVDQLQLERSTKPPPTVAGMCLEINTDTFQTHSVCSVVKSIKQTLKWDGAPVNWVDFIHHTCLQCVNMDLNLGKAIGHSLEIHLWVWDEWCRLIKVTDNVPDIQWCKV